MKLPDVVCGVSCVDVPNFISAESAVEPCHDSSLFSVVALLPAEKNALSHSAHPFASNNTEGTSTPRYEHLSGQG